VKALVVVLPGLPINPTAQQPSAATCRAACAVMRLTEVC